jgi:hypothetical protein
MYPVLFYIFPEYYRVNTRNRKGRLYSDNISFIRNRTFPIVNKINQQNL